MFIPGTRIRLIRPPEGFEHLQGKCGKILRLLPMPQDPLVYCARIEQTKDYEVDLNVSPGEVEVLIHREEQVVSEQEDDEEITEVNGLYFCRKHRLEVCGKCAIDLRHSNLVKELGDFEEVEQAAEELDQALDAMNFPNRKAPGTDHYNPVVTPSIVVIPDNLDPASLPQWPRDLDMEKSARMAFGPNEHKVEEEAKLPLRRVRETLVVLGHRVQHFYEKRQKDNDSALRILLQNEAQSDCLCLDIVEPIRELHVRVSPAETSLPLPLFVVRWAHARASNQDHAMRIMSTMTKNSMMANIPSELDEIALIAEILKANAAKLDPSFANKTGAQPPLAVSALAAIPLTLQTAYYEELGEYCQKCGTSGVKMLQCSRCKKARYCSKECQKKNWKYHRGFCVATTAQS